MEAIRLEFQPEIKEKILNFLSSFSSDELKITPEDPDFDENKKKVHAAYANLKNGTAKLYTLEEVDEILENTISKHED
ncbi:hypothetical protein ASE21_09710 [Flavobacterium sp. Root901]|uniref:hypothetical protein n=1 Tax=Flavobacterium sp. Root901 TaxID=1736605 RepID=UPI00070ECDC7|nr:hypothetical protein [Flavobacterium sp. Root901]KRD09991.1 hypothetical protein ASE21_09710 [Flavobacterium sp. Root901]